MEKELTKNEEDYLRIIYYLDENEGVRSIDITKELDITKASVSEMLKKLSKKRLVSIKPYSRVFLTEKGEKIAGELFKKHRISKILIKSLLNCDDKEAMIHAHDLEHAFSLEAIEKLEQAIEGNQRYLPSYVG
jgi:DtxR family Mn-dependent transcriptional regulator